MALLNYFNTFHYYFVTHFWKIFDCRKWPYPDLVVEESPCPRGSSRTNLQVQVLVLFLVFGYKVFENFQGLCILKLCAMYDQVLPPLSMRLRQIMSSLLMSDITYWYMSASKPFFSVTQCCCPCPCAWASSPWIQDWLHLHAKFAAGVMHGLSIQHIQTDTQTSLHLCIRFSEWVVS